MHYQRAIWSHEDPQQRLLRYRQIERLIPTEWIFEPIGQNDGAQQEIEISTLLDNLSNCEDQDSCYVCEVQGQFRGVGGHVPFHELINPAGPIGYFGNYSVFYIRPEYKNATYQSNLTEVLKILKLPYLYFAESGSEGEFMDPVLKKYITDLSSNSSDDNLLDNEIKYKMVQFVPKLRLEYEIAKERNLNPTCEADRTAIDTLMSNNKLFSSYYAEYLYRDEMSRRIVIDTNNLIMDIIPGDGCILENFKRTHRGIDVLKALEELTKIILENKRREMRINAENYDDPDSEQKIQISIGEFIQNLKSMFNNDSTP